MAGPFVQIDLHGMRQDEAVKVIDRAIASAGPSTYQIRLVHGYNRGTSLRTKKAVIGDEKLTSIYNKLYGFEVTLKGEAGDRNGDEAVER